MANICVNNIAFIASNNNLEELKRLYNDIEKISNYDKNFGDLEEMFEITTLENRYSYFIISTATSWTPKPEVWDSILNEYSEIDMCTHQRNVALIFILIQMKVEKYLKKVLLYIVLMMRLRRRLLNLNFLRKIWFMMTTFIQH